MPLIRMREPLFECACHEGNYSLRILAGARKQEKETERRTDQVVGHRSPMRIVKPGDFTDERVKALLTNTSKGHANSPPGHVFALDWSGLQQPEISFYALWEGEDLLGVGALKELEPGMGEIKSMRTADAHLRRVWARRFSSTSSPRLSDEVTAPLVETAPGCR